MSRIIIKNSTTAGNIPSSLAVGELAINTADGKLYYSNGSVVKLLAASGSSGGGGGGTGTVTSVQLANGTGISLSGTNPITTAGTITITNSAPDQTVVLNNGTGISVTGTYPTFTITNTITTGSLLTTSSFNNWTGSSSSQFSGTASYATTASYALNGGSGGASTGSNASASFTNQSTWTFTHNLNNRFVVVETFDSSYNQIIPQTLTLTDANTATITFPTLESGYAIASIGGANITNNYYSINNTASALFATTGSNTFNGNQTVNGWVSASLGFTGSLLGTASYLSQTVIDSILADAIAYAVAL